MPNLKDARRSAGLTQTQLAAESGIDQRTISRLENGRVRDPSHRIVVRISLALGVHPQEIAEFRVNAE
jgi:transcriptional regulator with XRE-family HTH domain